MRYLPHTVNDFLLYRLHPKTGQSSARMDLIRNEIEKKTGVEMKKTMKKKEKWESLSDFEKLPDDILIQIITFLPDSMGVLRETSSTMKKSVGRFRNLRKHKPAISFMCIEQDKLLPRLSLTVHLDRNTAQYFDFPRSQQLSSWNIRYSRIAENNSKFLGELKKSLSLNVQFLYLTFERDVNLGLLEWLFNGMNIECVALVIPNIFDSARLLDFIAKTGVEKISISIRKLSISNPEDFLLGLAEICTEIDLWQCTDESITKNSGFFFGIANFDWGRVFPEMFKRKMDSLCISNCSFLPESKCEELVENMCKVSYKELRFTSSYLPVEIVAGETNRTVNDYNISKINEYGSNAFSITHKNRQQFDGV